MRTGSPGGLEPGWSLVHQALTIQGHYRVLEQRFEGEG